MADSNILSDFGINILEEEIDDVIFQTNEFLTDATFTGSQGPFWWILQMCMALAALFSIVVAGNIAYKMMVKHEPLDVMKLFRPLAISVILCWWYPPADTGITNSGSSWCFLDFLSYIPNCIGSYTHDLYQAESLQIEDKFEEVQELIYVRDTLYTSLQAQADVAHSGTSDPNLIESTMEQTGVEEVTNMEKDASRLWFTSLTAGAVVGLDKIIMLIALIVYRIGWWANMFWDNRNRQQEHPEEIDDEQLYCLYNLLILYHIQNDELLDTIIRIKDEETLLYEELTSFFGKNEKTEVKDVIKSVIERLQKAGNFPLTWFERLNLLSPGFFKFAYNKLNTLTSYCKKFNEMQLYIGESDSEKTSRTYQLCMCEGSFGRTLPLLYALLAYQEGETELFDWMRTMRNLILNTVIGSEDLPSIIKDIDAFSTLCKNSNIYTVLQSDDVKNVLDKFNKSQVKEETRKASMPEFKDEMINMENGRFFRGRIGILFRMLKEQEGYDCMSKENVKSYSSVLLELFDGNDNGLSTKFEKDYLLRRALMSFPPYYFGKEVSSCWSFNNGLTEWREYITQEDYDISSLQQLMKKLLIPEFKSGKDLVNVLSEYITDISSNFEEDIRKKDKDSHRYYFIKYPAIWAFMDTKRCVWNDNNYDIVLKSANGNNSNRMELRTISLFLDYKEKKDSINQQGWSVSIWPKEKSCMYFDFKIPGEENRTIAIDVYFYDDNGNRNSEDCYAFDLFIRPTHYDAINDEERKLFADKCFTQNESLFSSIIPEYSELFKKNDNGRLKSQVLYSKYNLKNILTKILSDISSYYKK